MPKIKNVADPKAVERLFEKLSRKAEQRARQGARKRGRSAKLFHLDAIVTITR
jgi:hypothetical protein